MATKNKPGVETAKGELVITRIFDAPRERVWKAWTEPREVMRWWGPKIFTSPSCKIDFRVGGKYLFCMRSDSGPEVWQKGLWSTGVYKEIVPMEKIVCTDCFADEQGNVVPASHYGFEEDFPLQMLVTITFEKLEGNRTRMTLRHAGLPAGEHTKGANQGWNESFDKLAASLTESNSQPLVIERILNAPAASVWKALTDRDQMKQWYFDLAEFKPQAGFKFQFYGGTEEKQYLHLCKITEVIPGKKLAYSWRYDGHEGNSLVAFELFVEGDKTRLKLTHDGLETFPKSNPDLAKENFVQGWTSIIGTSLKEYVENKK